MVRVSGTAKLQIQRSDVDCVNNSISLFIFRVDNIGSRSMLGGFFGGEGRRGGRVKI